MLDLPVVDHPSRDHLDTHDIVLLTTKTQDTAVALDALASVAPPLVPILCVQNGVENERWRSGGSLSVYGVYVWCPTVTSRRASCKSRCAPTPGILDVGCYPSGSDELAVSLAAAFRSASFYAEARGDIMRWKYRKLLSNLGNAVDALCGRAARGTGIVSQARREATACFRAAGIGYVSDEDEADPVRREREIIERPLEASNGRAAHRGRASSAAPGASRPII